MTITGALRYKTAFHSIQLSGVIANSVYDANIMSWSTAGQTLTHREEWDVQDGEMQSHAYCNRTDKERIVPHGHDE